MWLQMRYLLVLPMRDIQHHIDLILGTVLPNKAGMSANEHEELPRKVDDLITKGLVEEIKSHCVCLYFSCAKERWFFSYV